MEMNAESVLDALNDFERKPMEIPPILEDYLLRVAQNGEIVFPWGKLKPLLKRKLEVVLDEFYETCPVEITVPVPNFETFNFDSLKKTILQAVEAFTSAPFTIQRICELITNPKKHYNRTDKYMRGIEKNVLVVSTVEPRLGVQNDANANVSPIVNGMIDGESPHDDNDCFNGHENNENDPSNNLNTPANHVLLDNFANVFPSAACIPSPSNICINREVDSLDREIDSNFIPSTAECVETQEVEFAPQVSMESDESVEPEESVESTEEQMDTTTEEPDNCPIEETAEVTKSETDEVEESCESKDQQPESEKQIEDKKDSKKRKLPEENETVGIEVTETTSSIDEDVSDDVDTNADVVGSAAVDADASSELDASAELDTSVDLDASADLDVSVVNKNDKNEADSSETTPTESDAAVPTIEPVSTRLQQDDTISQSDDSTTDTSEVSQSDDASDSCEVSVLFNNETPAKDATEVSQSVDATSDSSEQCMELESSTEEPSV